MSRRFSDVLRRALSVAGALTISIFAIPSATVPVGGPTAAESPAAAPAPLDWLAEARRSISEREYEATDAGAGLQAPNRANEFRVYFEPDGARVVDRADDRAELACLRTVAVGGRPVGAGDVVANGARVEVRRLGLVEWFENSERGLEQGWTFEARPDGAEDLSIDVAFAADVRVEGGRAIVDADGRRLEYGGLRASDATGRELAARMESAGGGRLRIVVDDSQALYPVTVDPTLAQPPYATLTGDQSSAGLGCSVAAAGDVNNDGYDDAIVGARYYDAGQLDEGAAFVFLGGPGGIASAGATAASARLESNQENAQMGGAVAGAGDVNGDGYADVIVGAELYDAGENNEGAAFVFLGGPGGIASGSPSTAATTLEANQVNARLGFSVASAGDVNDDGKSDVVVGAVLYDAGQADEGAALVFLGSPSGIPNGNPASANTVLEGDQGSSRFGASVASAGDTNGDGYDDVLVGARLYDSGQTDEGAAFVFLGGPSGIAHGSPASASATLQSNQDGAYFGVPAVGAGDVNNDGYDDVVVGSAAYDSGQTDEGAAFVFLGGMTGVASGNPSTAYTVVQSDQTGSQLGNPVAAAGDVNADGYDDLLVGAPSYDAGQGAEGIVLLVLGGPTRVANVSPATAAAVLQADRHLAQMGVSVAGLGDVDNDGYGDVVVGADQYDTAATASGAAFVYYGDRDGLSGFPKPAAVVRGGQTSSLFGRSVASAGDVNGDGFDDLIVGAYAYDAGQLNEGAAFIFLGGPNGIPPGGPEVAATVLQSDQPDADLGVSVAGAGDVNGDGFDDVIVGAFAYDGGQQDEGAAFVFLGGPNGVPSGNLSTASATLESNQAGAQCGYGVAGAGDVNNDGFDDVIVGAPFYDSGQTDEGEAFVFLGSASGVANGNPSTANAVIEGNQTNAYAGQSVDGAGDVNNDGYDDIAVGAPSPVPGIGTEGKVLVYLGGFGGIGSAPSTTIRGTQLNTQLGFSVAGAGDVNNDGYDDIVAGAPAYDSGQTDEGAVFVFVGGPSGIGVTSAAQAATRIESETVGGGIGTSVAGVGDVNGDGFDDIGLSAQNDGVAGRAAAVVFLGGPTGVPSGTLQTAAATLSVTANTAAIVVAGAGDVNGDGFDDVVVGSSDYTVSVGGEGAAFVYHLVRPAVAPAGSDTVGIYVSGSGAWFLRNANASGGADVIFTFGAGGAGLVALRGDWNGDGVDTPGLYAPSTGAFFLRNSNSPGGADIVFTFGAANAGLVPMVGDWNGDGVDTVGLYAPSTSVFFLRNQNGPGPADVVVGFGPSGAGWTPMSGDWNGDGTDTVGLYDPVNAIFFLRNQNAPGAADVVFGFGPPGAGWTPLSGDFDGDGDDTVGLYSPSNGFFFLRNANAAGGADLTFGYGPSNVTPLVGDWDGQ